MREKVTRWTLPDLQSAITWCKKRNQQGICCTMDILGEDVRTEKQIELFKKSVLTYAHTLDKQDLDAAIAVKSTSIGAIFDKKAAQINLQKLFNETAELNVNLEIDMEGTPLVEFTIDTALDLAASGYYVTLALQAYLNRTPEDIKHVIEHDIKVRLVKGAYIGDEDEFKKIQQMYKSCFELLFETGQYFSLGTHDPELIDWIKKKVGEQKDIFEFGFLKGLADETKLELVKDGWAVSEYIPFGYDSKAYVKRRKRYLRELEKLGREPAP